MKDSPIQEDKPKLNKQGEVQEVKVAPTLPLSKDWRFATSHPKELIIGDVSKGETTRSKLHDFVVILLLFLILNQRKSSKSRVTHIGCLQSKKSSINLSTSILLLNPMIGQPFALNGST